MLHAVPHRGSIAESIALGRALLGICHDGHLVDVWLAGRDGTAAVLAGGLDNAHELADALRSAGITADPANPAAVIIGAFRIWGDEAPSRLRGTFSGAVTDGVTLRCFRDQFGFRTFFFRDDGALFMAADEAKQLTAGVQIERRADVEAAEAIFFERVDERQTALRGVERVPRATIGTVGLGGRPTFQRYWDPRPLLESSPRTAEEASEGLVEVLERVIARAVTGADSVALSGGLDSPTVAAFAARPHLARSGRPLLALTSVYPDYPSTDERPYVELVANHLGIELHTYVQEAMTLDDLDRWVDLVDGPWSALPVPHAVEHYELARSLGAKRIFTGDVAEYLFEMPHHLIGHLILHGRWRAATRWVGSRRAQGRTWKEIARAIAPSVAPAFLARLYVRRRRSEVLARQLGGTPSWISPQCFETLGRRPDLERPARLRWLDWQVAALSSGVWTGYEAGAIAAAHVGVEVSRPLADVDVWEFMLSLRAEAKYPSAVPKDLVRQAMRGWLPEALLAPRPKTQFGEHMLGTADYDGLCRWLIETEYRLEGVDYTRLSARLERRELNLIELAWAYNLARLHAFVSVLA